MRTTPAQTWYFSIGPVVISVPQLIAFIGSVICTLALWYYLQTHRLWAAAIRASSQNPTAATLMGIDVPRTYLLRLRARLRHPRPGFGSLMIPLYYTSPTVGLFLGLIMFVVVVLGGMGNLLGAFVGGHDHRPRGERRRRPSCPDRCRACSRSASSSWSCSSSPQGILVEEAVMSAQDAHTSACSSSVP